MPFFIPRKARNVFALIREKLFRKDEGTSWEDVVQQRQSNCEMIRMGRKVRLEWIMSRWSTTALLNHRQIMDVAKKIVAYLRATATAEPVNSQPCREDRNGNQGILWKMSIREGKALFASLCWLSLGLTLWWCGIPEKVITSIPLFQY